jgi:hypothetical protein
MLRVTDDVVELRRWAQEHGGAPCRRRDGTLTICFGAVPDAALPVDWGEFEANFVLAGCVLVYDDAPGCTHCFVGPTVDARAYVAAADPRASGSAGPTP